MFQSLLSIAASNPEGFTVAIPSLEMIKAFTSTGIVVAYAETQNCFGTEGLKKVIFHAESHDRYVGGWLDEETGLYYFDSVRIFPESKQAEALKFGRQNGQIAVFRLSDARVIKC
ncbi:hypothetical protein [Siphonobacter sp.]|uniref:hypothetical protein n=1 Tax=Siphonobacter sp. TaxID=1869184 RepID=UPI003B3A01B1